MAVITEAELASLLKALGLTVGVDPTPLATPPEKRAKFRANVWFVFDEVLEGITAEEYRDTLEEHLRQEGEWGYLSRGEFEEADFVAVRVDILED